MTTNMGFPSNKKHEIDFTPGFSAQERKYLTRKPLIKKDYLAFLDSDWMLVGVVFLLVILLSFVQFVIMERIVPTPRAEAAEIQDEATLCREFLEGKWNVIEEDMESVQDFCANL